MGGIPFWEFLLRILILYLTVMLSLRVMGKREIGQLSVFDFVVSVMIAELSTLPMEDTDVPIYRSLISIAGLVVLQIGVALLQLKSHRFRHWVDGEPSVLIEHGQIKDKEMRRLRYTMHDLLTQLREKGYSSVADVEFAILETSGQLSVLANAESRPVTPRDMSLLAMPTSLPLPVVIDGTPVAKTLQQLGRDETWLVTELKKQGFADVHNVFYATVDAGGTLWVDELDARDEPTRSGYGQSSASSLQAATSRSNSERHPRN